MCAAARNQQIFQIHQIACHSRFNDTTGTLCLAHEII